MTIRQFLSLAAAATVLLGGTACGSRENAPLGAETDEPLFVQGKQLQKQSRNSEALTSFLNLIEKRGERAAPESHLEAGLIYLNHAKDPVEAYHHFRKYLDLQPSSKEAPYVRGMVDAARREFARTLSARPLEDQSVRLEIAEEISKLRRENEELRAELAARRGVAAPQVRSPMITIPDMSGPRAAAAPPVAQIADSPITPAPQRAANTPQPTQSAQLFGASPVAASPAPRTTGTPPRTTAAPRPTPAAPQATKSSGKTHTVVAGDTWYNLSKRFGVRMEDLAAANGMSINTPLKRGAVLKIP
jgi:LysM repeat protein